ncbi:hypothetical protein D3C80_1115210 [compost metagenome]
MLGCHQQPWLGVETTFTVEQRLQAGTSAVGQNAADDGRCLLGSVFKLGHAAGDNHRLGAHVDGLTGLGDRRVSAEGRHRFTLAGDQHQVVGLGAGAWAGGEGVDQTDDRGRRQCDGACAGVNVGDGNAVEESTHR